ncbi:hypothetical protein GCM10010345_50830 [Streptomyces canarius]|uniref:Uncharacterized protein n=1 Tax=Streptomyces canarius TaxID=285453 RepID=A0ABQ3CQZ8_9ACTN|nr:hypothetical protein GCM10010345_50830 [Streptomyces canarius]
MAEALGENRAVPYGGHGDEHERHQAEHLAHGEATGRAPAGEGDGSHIGTGSPGRPNTG